MDDVQISRNGQRLARASSTDQVYEVLYKQVLSLQMPPGTKLSEADMAKQLGVSRQPVRDAFFRLSQQGFLLIQPQKATRVTSIRVQDIRKARFVRTAIEVEVMRRAAEALSEADIAELREILAAQKESIDAARRDDFHRLDNQFHQLICDRSGLGFVWEQISENKAHTDRVRFLSLASGSVSAWQEHVKIVQQLEARDAEGAVLAMREHLSKIEDVIEQLRAENHDWFSDEV